MWHNENHFSIHLSLKPGDSRKLREVSESLGDAYPDLFIPPPDSYAFPVSIYHFPFPPSLRRKNDPDTIKRYLNQFTRCNFWHPGTIRFSLHSLLISELGLQLYLTPTAPSDQSMLTRIQQELQDHYGCEPCTPTVTIAQLNPRKLFPADAPETLETLLQKLDREMTAELRSLSLQIQFDNNHTDPWA